MKLYVLTDPWKLCSLCSLVSTELLPCNSSTYDSYLRVAWFKSRPARLRISLFRLTQGLYSNAAKDSSIHILSSSLTLRFRHIGNIVLVLSYSPLWVFNFSNRSCWATLSVSPLSNFSHPIPNILQGFIPPRIPWAPSSSLFPLDSIQKSSLPFCTPPF